MKLVSYLYHSIIVAAQTPGRYIFEILLVQTSPRNEIISSKFYILEMKKSMKYLQIECAWVTWKITQIKMTLYVENNKMHQYNNILA